LQRTYSIYPFALESFTRGMLWHRYRSHCCYNITDIIIVITSRGMLITKRGEDFERRKTTIATGGIKNSFVMGLHQQGTSVSGRPS